MILLKLKNVKQMKLKKRQLKALVKAIAEKIKDPTK
jgi:hypothetical protein